MLIFIFIILAFICNGMRMAEENQFFNDYLDKKNTTMINGIFVILVFFSHCTANVTLRGIYDSAYITMKDHLLQMVVVPFLFYSGYGMMESIYHKEGYVKKIPRSRLIKVLLHFDVAVIIYLILQFIMGKTYGLKHIILSLIGWRSVGNSNWYIFVILLLYAVVYVVFSIIGSKRRMLGVMVITSIILVYMMLMIHCEQPTRFYNTILLFPFGMFYSMGKDKIETVIMKNDVCYIITFLFSFLSYYYCYRHAQENIVYYVLWGYSFMTLVLLFTMKIQLRNPLLNWFGNNIFGIYILQRIPMNVLKYLGYSNRTYVYLLSCLFATIFLTVMFNILLNKIDKRLFS